MMDCFNLELWHKIKERVAHRRDQIFPNGGLEAEHWYWKELNYQYRAYFEPPQQRCSCCGQFR